MARLLIVDDAAFMRKMLADMVAGKHEVCGEAANGVEAIEKYKELKPDVVTMDITMPEMQGIEAMREILAIDQEAKVLICSAIGHRQKVLEAMKNGARDFLVKPFQKEQILDAISRLV
ncbi:MULTISPECIES: response regulator [Brevibacillus]|uniref:Two-component response regulator n=2 Tax=Brevibacillus borstelensis TaxID=45462 RepID=M8DB22_9BACL|nr:response regulator [Brevibacillus borstelensis]EMT50532.1 two-component response regulator [Brevibacillus borstelensis AK1]KKX57024.1 regulator [Brevibacillus borstelensis cifa_chp40]MBE5395267.1 response regulator [Brevibacillus borstelensis]MCC0563896.1 response regulator [Brevibacillus borstelensis]MED1742515.1 response regulator [Brevibacillus borstelensis]